MRPIMAFGLLLATAGISLPVEAAQMVGVTTMTIDVPDRRRSLNVTLWYPAKGRGTPVRVGDNPVFEGVEGQQDAPIADGPFPLILVSHGGTRAAPTHGNWLGARLAARGFVVAAVRGPKIGPRDAGIALEEIWQRPADLSATLSALEDQPTWSRHLDRRKVGAVGFFLGGTAVLSLVGARFDAAQFMESCDEGGTNVDCSWFAASGVDLRAADTGRLTRSNLDPRVRVAIAVDPEHTTSLSAESLSRIAVPVDVINLGRPEAIAPGLRAAKLASAIPGAQYYTIPDATPFSAFSLCKPQGSAILKEEGESDTICREVGDQRREVVHAQMTDIIAGKLARRLQ